MATPEKAELMTTRPRPFFQISNPRSLGRGVFLGCLLFLCGFLWSQSGLRAWPEGALSVVAENRPISPNSPRAGDTAAPAPKSVILMIGDGMGPQEIGLYLDVADAIGIAPTALERATSIGSISLVRTGSTNSPITDSAASATALATGVNTKNSAVAVDPAGELLPSCVEDAKRTGRQTAIVTSTRLTHATPACFYAHAASRDDENTIARQALSGEIDILLGGGAKHFLGGVGGQELGKEMRRHEYQLIRTKEELAAAPSEGRLLGLFAADNLPYRVDRDGDEGEPTHVPTLAEMTDAALDRLDADRGFFLMVEGGRIDHAGHANDAGSLVGEMREFDQALSVVLDYISQHPEVALIVTADHETGGLCFSYRGTEHPTADHLRQLANTPGSAKVRLAEEVSKKRAREVLGSARLPFVPKETWSWNVPALERSVENFVSFGSQGHSGTPIVMVHAGPGERFPALTDHAGVGQVLRAWMSMPVRKDESER